MKEPVWLTKQIIEAIHISQIQEHGGRHGVRDKNLMASALARPMNRWAYEQSDIITLAAVFGYGLAKNYCFMDGNKGVAFMAMYTFLGINGFEIDVTEPEVVDLMLGVAADNISEEQLIRWLRMHVIGTNNK